MQVLRDEETWPRPPEGTALTIGAYDGVHRGHQAVISQVRRLAGERGLRTAVVTFDRHPASVVRPGATPKTKTLVGLAGRISAMRGSAAMLSS